MYIQYAEPTFAGFSIDATCKIRFCILCIPLFFSCLAKNPYGDALSCGKVEVTTEITDPTDINASIIIPSAASASAVGIIFIIIGELYESFVRKRALVQIPVSK